MQLQLQSACPASDAVCQAGSALEPDYESECNFESAVAIEEASESDANCESEVDPEDNSESKTTYESKVRLENMSEPDSDPGAESEVYYDAEDEIQSEDECEPKSSSKAESNFEPECAADNGSEAESDAVDDHLAPLSHSAPAASAPAAASFAFKLKAEAQSFHTGQALPSSQHSTSPVSSQDQSARQVQHAQQEEEDAAGVGGTCSNSKQHIGGFDLTVSVSHGQGAEHKQEASQQASAVGTAEHSKHSCLSGLTPSFRKMKRKSRASAESATFRPAAALATAADETAAAWANPLTATRTAVASASLCKN